MSKLIIAMLSCVSLSGCMWQTVDYLDMEAAQRFCADKNGTKIIAEYFFAGTEVMCWDGTPSGIDDLARQIEAERNMQH